MYPCTGRRGGASGCLASFCVHFSANSFCSASEGSQRPRAVMRSDWLGWLFSLRGALAWAMMLATGSMDHLLRPQGAQCEEEPEQRCLQDDVGRQEHNHAGQRLSGLRAHRIPRMTRVSSRRLRTSTMREASGCRLSTSTMGGSSSDPSNNCWEKSPRASLPPSLYLGMDQ